MSSVRFLVAEQIERQLEWDATKGFLLALEIINNEPINHIETRDILGDAKEVKLNMYFFSEKMNEICRLETIIASRKSKSEGTNYSIVSESLWKKNVDEVTTRKAMLDFEGKEPAIIRSGQEEFLSDDGLRSVISSSSPSSL